MTDKLRGFGLALILGVVIGVVLFGALRFFGQPEATHGPHYHANWAVVIDGKRLDLTANRYMEDVFQCSVDPNRQRPEDRVHMHEGNMDVVHVHDAGVTWGHFLANLGFGVGDDYLETDQGRFTEGEGRALTFILNGRRINGIRNQPIANQDRLLISFGAESVEAVQAEQAVIVEENAADFNVIPDPASCAGAQEETLGDRLRRAFWY